MEHRAPEARFAFATATAAVVLAAAFTVWVLSASAYNTGETVLEANPGFGHQLTVAMPLLVCAITWMLLHLACRLDSRRAKTVGTVLAWLLLAVAFLSGFSIGLLFMPAAALLVVGASLTPVRSRP